MKKYEYLVVEITDEYFRVIDAQGNISRSELKNSWKQCEKTGLNYPTFLIKRQNEVLNYFGEQGWRAIQIRDQIRTNSTNRDCIFFERECFVA